MAKHFLPYDLNQRLLLPPDLREWLPEGHLASFVSDTVEQMDLSAILKKYEKEDDRGRAGHDPRMMVKLLVYGYCTGKRSSRALEKATYDEVPYRVLAADQHPDHDCIADFRKRHLAELGGLFLQALRLCEKAGLVKLGHVAIDGTKVKANASKHKAMSYDRMSATEKRLEEEVQKLLAEAEQVDAEEDAKYGKGKRGDELPEELRRRESRIAKIREAKAALEQEARERAEQEAAEARAKIEKRQEQQAQTGQKMRGRPPEVKNPEEAKPSPKAQRNFTDPESRIMKDGATKSFEQAYNAQIAVDAQAQIIVATSVTQETNDKKQLGPMLKRVKENVKQQPQKVSADSGYFSEEAVTAPELAEVDLHVPPDRQKHGEPLGTATKRGPQGEAADRMREKLKSPDGHAVYARRKAIVEPVFGQIKEWLRFRRFSLRGLGNVQAEWDFVCAAHNLLKLFRARSRPQAACAA
jgi:transposase